MVRIVLQDLIGFGTLNDLSAMRAAAERLGVPPGNIEPLVPVDVVVDHSVEIDVHNRPDAVQRNQEIEFKRNAERYLFVKWAQGAFKTVRVVPPGNGIIHQINMEYLSQGVWEKDGVYFPDTVFGTDSHTTMVNGIGVVAWGVGGIEAEAGMLGQPNAFLTPDVVGCHMTGKLREGVTATDLALTVTELMRKAKVVGRFVEFFGEGAAALTAADRCTVANMAPEYGATMGYFPVDEKTIEYFRSTGRPRELVSARSKPITGRRACSACPQKARSTTPGCSSSISASIVPSLSGPKRPQDRVSLPELGSSFDSLFSAPVEKNGYARPAADLVRREPTGHDFDVGHGDVLIAPITSCTNTSNPALLIAAGLLAKRAVEKGLTPHPRIKTSLAPGSKVVTAYLRDAGLLASSRETRVRRGRLWLHHLHGRGRTAGCEDRGSGGVEGSRDLRGALRQSQLRSARARQPARELSCESRARGRVCIGRHRAHRSHQRPPRHRQRRQAGLSQRPVAQRSPKWRRSSGSPPTPSTSVANTATCRATRSCGTPIPTVEGAVYKWDDRSTFIKEPPFFEGVTRTPGAVTDIVGARALAILGDSITTDHISPSTPIRPGTPAGKWLSNFDAPPSEWGHFGVRRCNHELMVRGTFANVRLRNAVAPGTEGPDHQGPARRRADDDLRSLRNLPRAETRRSSSSAARITEWARRVTGRQRACSSWASRQ